nr:hypothetical protein [uncultured Fluviicola sp.]
MKRILHLSVICFIIQSVTCSAQINDVDMQYLSTKAVFFSNGVYQYQESGKYGFRNSNEKVTAAIYDTLFKLGANFCAAKQGDSYQILNERLENKFATGIRSIETCYWADQYKNKCSFIITTSKGLAFEYMTYDLLDDAISPLGKHIPEYFDLKREPKTRIFPAAAIEKTEQVNKPPNPIGGEYMAESLFLFRDPNHSISYVIDTSTNDTVFQYITGMCYVHKVDNQFYLFHYSKQDQRHAYRIMNLKGEEISTFVQTVSSKEGVCQFKHGLILEEIEQFKHKKYKPGYYRGYTIYSFPDGKLLRKRVIEIGGYSDSEDSWLFIDMDRDHYTVWNKNRLLDEFSAKNISHIGIDSPYSKEVEHEFIEVVAFGKKDHVLFKRIIGVNGNYRKIIGDDSGGINYNPFFGTHFIILNQADEVKDGIYDGKKDVSIYDKSTDSVVLISKQTHWFEQIGTDLFIVKDPVFRIVNRNGESVPSQPFDECRVMQLSDKIVVELENKGITTIYLNEMVPLYENSRISAPYPSPFLQLHQGNSSTFRLLGPDLKPISEKEYRAIVFIPFGLTAALLTVDGTIEYLDVDLKNR